jgi:hypothetical protein
MKVKDIFSSLIIKLGEYPLTTSQGDIQRGSPHCGARQMPRKINKTTNSVYFVVKR